MQEPPAINPLTLHRVSYPLCDGCETASHCMKKGCIGITEEAPMPTAEQAQAWLIDARAWLTKAPAWLLILLATALFIAVLLAPHFKPFD